MSTLNLSFLLTALITAASFLALAFGLVLTLWTGRAFTYGTCQACGFDLHHHAGSNTNRVCPECGEAIPAIGRHRPAYRLGEALLIFGCGGLIAAFVLGVGWS